MSDDGGGGSASPPGEGAGGGGAARRRARRDIGAELPSAKRLSSGGAAAPAPARPPPPPLSAAELAELRSKSAVLLAEALQDPTPLYDHGCAVEAAAFAAGGSGATREYTVCVRRLVANLRRNDELRSAVLSGAVSPADLPALPPEALATAAQREAHEASVAAATRRATADDADGGFRTEAHACPSCGTCDALLVRVGGARDIGKSETWGSKDAQEAILLRLTCVPCKHEWKKAL